MRIYKNLVVVAGLVCAVQAQGQVSESYDVTAAQRGGVTCVCHIDTGNAVECGDLSDGSCAGVASTCVTSGDAQCPNGLCVAAAVTGCPTNSCFVQSPACHGPCPVPSGIGSILACVDIVPAVSEWGLIVLTTIGLIVGTIVFRRTYRLQGA